VANRRKGLFRLLRKDDGSHLVEAIVGMLVLSVVVMGFAGAMSSSMSLVGHSRQRSSGSSVAVEKLERIRSYPYAQVAIDASDPANIPLPSHSTDTTHPNNKVSVDGTQYQYGESPSEVEPIFYDGVGSVPHIEDPVDIDGTEFRVFQYVTWHLQPSVKRVVVVVQWKFPVRTGTAHQVVQSTFVTDGTITLVNPTPTPTGATPTPGPSLTPGPTSTPAPSCNGNNPPAGSMTVLSTDFTNSTTVQLSLLAGSDDCLDVMAKLTNQGPAVSPRIWTDVILMCTKQCPPDSVRPGAGFGNPNANPPVPATVGWTVPSGDGTKTFYLKFTDGKPNDSPIYSKTIVLDQTNPSTPTNFGSTCTTSGSDRIVNMTWTSSTDTNLVGHRVYRSVENGPFNPLPAVTGNSINDTTKKSLTSVRYYVVGYDKAGNESVPTSATLTFNKNSCTAT
jgi:hypothetical protein